MSRLSDPKQNDGRAIKIEVEILGVIGAAVSAASYGLSGARTGALSNCRFGERLITINVNGKPPRVERGHETGYPSA